jgi:hypothetical protein
MQQFFFFFLDVFEHCVHCKIMGPFGAQSFIVVVAIVHNVVEEWQLELPP